MFEPFSTKRLIFAPIFVLFLLATTSAQKAPGEARNVSIGPKLPLGDLSRIARKTSAEGPLIIYYNVPTKRPATAAQQTSKPAPRADLGTPETRRSLVPTAKESFKPAAQNSSVLGPIVIGYRSYLPPKKAAVVGVPAPAVPPNRSAKTSLPLEAAARPASITSAFLRNTHNTTGAPLETLTTPTDATAPSTQPGIIETERVFVNSTVSTTTSVETAISGPTPLPLPEAPEVVGESSQPSAANLAVSDENSPLSSPPPTATALELVAWNNEAVALTQQRRFQEAQVLLERAIAADPSSAKFHRNLSIVYERLKKIDEALTYARTAADLAPEDPKVLEQLCGLELSVNNAAKALDCYEKLRVLEPLDVVSQTYYGLALFRTGKETEAVAVLEQAAGTNPPWAEAMNALGFVYFSRKRVEEAAKIFKNVVETAPEFYEGRYNLAVTYLAQGNRTAAISQYKLIKEGDAALAAKLYKMVYGDKLLFVGDLEAPRK